MRWGLSHSGGRKARRWSYKEGQGIGVMLGQQQLDIAIRGQQVQVGAAPACSSVDALCIVQAVRAQLQGLTPEESAADNAGLRLWGESRLPRRRLTLGGTLDILGLSLELMGERWR